MKQIKRIQTSIPPWNMPSDPVKAVFWFMHWLLKVLVRFFWIPILLMSVLETYLNWKVSGIINGLVGGGITILVGMVVWAVLYVVLLFVNVSSGISKAFSEVGRLQRNTTTFHRSYYPFNDTDPRENVVEGTITDLEEERRKRRRAEE